MIKFLKTIDETKKDPKIILKRLIVLLKQKKLITDEEISFLKGEINLEELKK